MMRRAKEADRSGDVAHLIYGMAKRAQKVLSDLDLHLADGGFTSVDIYRTAA